HPVAHHHARPNRAPPPHARFLSAKMVLIRAISRRMARSCNGFPSASVARRNPRRKRSSVSTTSCCSSSSVFISRSASGFFLGMLALLPLHELRLDRQLGRRERPRLARQIPGHPLGAALEPLAELDALRCQHAPPVRLPSSTCGPTALRSSRA